MHSDHRKYAKFTKYSQIEKSINSLLGIIEGITIDCVINKHELTFLNMWIEEHNNLSDRHPYNELIPVVKTAISDGIFTRDEQEDITWLCDKLRSTEYFDMITADIQRLHGILGGIVADGNISETELNGLSSWLDDHDHLKSCWPYDEISSLITAVMNDRVIDMNEQKMLMNLFSEFISIHNDRSIVNPMIYEGKNIVGLCAVCPEICFTGSKFCFTGASLKYTRTTLEATVRRLGGEVSSTVNSEIRYLIIGANGNPCWAYACYGRKVEKAVELRKSGARLLIVHENDFHDAVADAG